MAKMKWAAFSRQWAIFSNSKFFGKVDDALICGISVSDHWLDLYLIHEWIFDEDLGIPAILPVLAILSVATTTFIPSIVYRKDPVVVLMMPFGLGLVGLMYR